ncbi:MAG: hypothetical protein LC772_06125, partial [Chloroflexi bacterium]|nr:hypothetical protein [Chloroflexota bacterium]
MKARKAGPVAWMALALTIAAGTSAFAMQPVVNRDGLSAGGEVGYNFGSFNGNLAVAGDVDYGLKTHFLNQTYTG